MLLSPLSLFSLVANRLARCSVFFIPLALGLLACGEQAKTPPAEPEVAMPSVDSESAGDAPAASADTVYAIAVLPFRNASSDPDQIYLADGLSEELLDLLAEVQSLRVVSRNSAFQFRDRNTDVAEVAESLGVAYVLQGSVRKTDADLQIAAQLVRAHDGAQLWAEEFDASLEQIFEIQDDIANAVVAALGIELADGALRAEAVNPDAYLLWLEGRFIYAKWGEENFERAIDAYQSALRIDPEYVEAWASLSVTYLSQTLSGYRELALGLAQARFAIEKALEFDPDRPSVLARLANIQTKFEWDWAGARETVNRALEIAPNDERVLGAAANLANSLGQGEEALRYREQALALDPFNLLSLYNVAEALHRLGRLSDARTAYGKVLELDPEDWGTHTQLAIIMLQQNEPEAAWRELGLEVDPQQQEYGRLLALPALGREDEVAERLKKFIEEHQSWAAYTLASIHAWHDDPDRAFLWLDHAFELHAAPLSQVLLEPTFVGLHEDPRWGDLLERMGLPVTD